MVKTWLDLLKKKENKQYSTVKNTYFNKFNKFNGRN